MAVVLASIAYFCILSQYHKHLEHSKEDTGARLPRYNTGHEQGEVLRAGDCPR